MYKAAGIFFILLAGFSVLLFAQDDSDPSVEADWDFYESELYVRGDQVFIITLGTIFPMMFVNNGSIIDNKIDPPLGGTGYLSYNYYQNSNIFTGGELGVIFLPTLGGNTVFIIPLGLNFGTHFIKGRFEFPIHFTLGMSWHNYLNLGYYGLYAKAGGSAYFRVNNDWSFGLTANWGWYPQWTNDKSKNVDGHFLSTMLCARYHF